MYQVAGKALTIDRDRVIPFSSCVIKEGKIYYLTPMCKVLVDSNTVICTSFDNCNRNIKTVGLVTIDDLNSEFPMYEGYESLRSEVLHSSTIEYNK